MKRLIYYGLVAILCFILGALTFKYRHWFKLPEQPIQLKGRIVPPVNEIKLDTVHLCIADSAYSQLKKNRAEALKNDLLTKEYRDKVLSELVYNRDTFHVEVRLKGDRRDHWEHPFKWSFRVKVKKGRAINGIKVFNFQQPHTRGNLNEWYFHELLDHFGLMNLRYKFVRTFINGQDAGVYAIEEYFDKRLIENNGLREGITFRFNTSKYWPYWPGLNSNDFQGSPIEPFNLGKKELGNPRFEQFLVAKDLVIGYAKGDYRLDEVFNVDQLAKYFAITDLTGHPHGAFIDNLKFYYNPIISRVEPIGYDNSIIKSIGHQSIVGLRYLLGERRWINQTGKMKNYPTWHDQLFADETFQKAYFKALEIVSNDKEIQTLNESVEERLVQNLSKIRVNKSNYSFTGDQLIKKNAAFIRKFITPKHALEAYIVEKDTLKESLEIELNNTHYAPLQFIGLKYKDSLIIHNRSLSILQASSIPGTQSFPVKAKFNLPSELLKKKKFEKRLSVVYTIPGTTKTFESTPYRWSFQDPENVSEIIKTRKSNYEDFPFIKSHADFVEIPKGQHVLSENLIVGAKQQLIIKAGAKIILKNEASIICYGGIQMIGNENEVIQITGEGGSGILVINSPVRSKLMHVAFNKLSNFELQYWKLPSAITFYQSDVDIEYVSFENNLRGDDYLNVFRSDVNLQNSSFKNINADAFDGDFVFGTVRNVSFDSIGNDALDFSGSQMGLYSLQMNGVADKAISGGERSMLKCVNLKIENCELAINSKDDSHVEIINSTLKNCKVAYVVFMKKAEYGPGWIDARAVNLENCKVEALVENQSNFFLNGVRQEHTHQSVKEMLYGNEFGKNSIQPNR